MKTRLLYVMLYIVSIFACWLFVTNGQNWVNALSKATHQSFCAEDKHCFGALSVYRITFGLSMFHGIMSLLMIGVRRGNDCRAQLQNGFWLFKVVALVLLVVMAFYIAPSFFVAYGWVALVCGVIFLFFQLVLLVDFAHSWSESWLEKYGEQEENRIWFQGLVVSSIVMFIASLVLVVVMYALFTGDDSTPGCSLNTVFITVALLSGLTITCLSIHPTVQLHNPKSGLLQPAVVFLYMVYLVWSAIMSEPAAPTAAMMMMGESAPLLAGCNTLTATDGPFGGSTQRFGVGMGAVLVIVAVTYSALRTSSKHDELLGGVDEEAGAEVATVGSSIAEVGEAMESQPTVVTPIVDKDLSKQPVTYNYSFFHFIFMLASMYICMLMTNWAVATKGADLMEKGTEITIDQSMASVWVKVASSWVVGLLFVWSLIAPMVCKGRSFGAED